MAQAMLARLPGRAESSPVAPVAPVVPGRIRWTYQRSASQARLEQSQRRRDTVYADLTQLRLTRMHARAGDAIRRLRPDDVSALAHHFLRAASAETALALPPVAQTLGELSAFLGHRAAARHFGTAEQVARLWGSPHWITRAQAARDRLGRPRP